MNIDRKSDFPGSPEGDGETKNERRAKIESAMDRMDQLSREKKIALLDRMKRDKIGGIIEGVFNYNGRILTDEEAGFLESRAMGLATNNLVVLGELIDAFPDLTDYFHGLLKKMDDLGR